MNTETYTPSRPIAQASLAATPTWQKYASERRWVGVDHRKAPRRPDGSFASTTNPATWVTLAEAEATKGEQWSRGVVGFVLTDMDPAELCAIDLDDVLDSNGEPLTTEIGALLCEALSEGCYVEKTPSGCGLRIIGRWPDHGGAQLNTPSASLPGGHGAMELYAAPPGRYITVTGDMLGEPPAKLGDVGGLISHLRTLPGVRASGTVSGRRDEWQPRTLEDHIAKEVWQRREEWAPDVLPFHFSARPAGNWRISSAELGRSPRLDEDLCIFPDRCWDYGTRRWQTPISLVQEFGHVEANGEIVFGGAPEYGPQGEEKYVVIGESDSAIRRPTEEEAAAWLATKLGGTPPQPGDSADEALARAIGKDLRAMKQAEVDKWFEPIEGNEVDVMITTATAARFRIEPLADILARDLDGGAPPLVHGLLDQGAMSVLYGDSNTGKTFVAMDMGFQVAAGRMWAGCKVEKTSVVYVAGEGSRGAVLRLRALHSRHPTAEAGHGFHLLSQSVNLRNSNEDLRQFVEAVRALGQPVGLIIFDTLSRAMAGGDENSSVDMGALVKNSDAIRAATGAHVMLVHHTGKDASKGARGHSLLRAATDTEIEVRPGQITVEKQRDMDGNWSRSFYLEPVVIGVDRAGQPLSSCVAIVSPSGAVHKAGVHNAPKEQILTALRTLAERAPAAVGFGTADVYRQLASDNPIAEATVRTHLRALEKAGRVAKTGHGRWRIADSLSDAAAKKPENPIGSLPVAGP